MVEPPICVTSGGHRNARSVPWRDTEMRYRQLVEVQQFKGIGHLALGKRLTVVEEELEARLKQ